MANPQDDTSLMRVVNFPTRGIGARTLETLADAARTHDISLYSAVAMVGGKGGSNLVQFAQLINRLIEETRDLPLPEMVEHMLEASGLNAHYKAEREGAERLENLNELITAAAVFASEENYDGMPAGVVPQTDASSTLMPGVVDAPIVAPDGMTPLAAFLSHAALEAGDNQAQQGQDAVQLMTVHAAKGLEFDAVFITGLEEGLFPHENSILEQSGLEERRLMYVAITRARQRLYITLAQSRMLHGQTRYAMRSRFLEEIPEAPEVADAQGRPGPGGRLAGVLGRQPHRRVRPQAHQHDCAASTARRRHRRHRGRQAVSCGPGRASRAFRRRHHHRSERVGAGCPGRDPVPRRGRQDVGAGHRQTRHSPGLNDMADHDSPRPNWQRCAPRSTRSTSRSCCCSACAFAAPT